MTKTELAQQLIKLSEVMQDAATDLDYYGGISDLAAKGRELMNVAFMVRDWGWQMLVEEPLMVKVYELVKRDLNNYKQI